jgi:hypothetical protein
MSDAFDRVFAGASTRTTVRRKLADGTTRTARLADGVVPESLTLTDVAEAAMKGTSLARRATDRGAGLSQSVSGVTGAAARSAVLAMGDAAPADVPAPTARRARQVAPSANGTPAEPTATS